MPLARAAGSTGKVVDAIHTDLTAGIDLTKARRLSTNKGVAFMGDTKGGPFDVPGDLGPRVAARARESQRTSQLRRAGALDERHGGHPAPR